MDKVRTKELFDAFPPYLEEFMLAFEYPWQCLGFLGVYIEKLISEGIEGYSEIKEGVLVGKDVKIAESAFIEGPAIIGDGCEIRHGAYFRGNVILGRGCVIGNSCELKNCVVLDNAQIPHFNYVGDSVLGNRAHLGAGAVCSNFKAGGSEVYIKGEREYKSGRRKLGAILGDGADMGCGCVLNPGTVVGKNTTAYPLCALRGVYGENLIIKSPQNIVERK